MGGRVVCADPPYQMHDIVPRALGCQVIRVPLRDWVHDLDAMAGAEAELAFICNPHNPTGTAVRPHDPDRALRGPLPGPAWSSWTEAYIDFADDPWATAALDLLALGNVVVTRTFSKLHGLAGLRIGYLAGPRDVVATLQKVRPPFFRQRGRPIGRARGAGRPRLPHPGPGRDASRPGKRRRRCSKTPGIGPFLPGQLHPRAHLRPRRAHRGASPGAPGSASAPAGHSACPAPSRVSIPSRPGLALLKHALTGIARPAQNRPTRPPAQPRHRPRHYPKTQEAGPAMAQSQTHDRATDPLGAGHITPAAHRAGGDSDRRGPERPRQRDLAVPARRRRRCAAGGPARRWLPDRGRRYR